MSIESEIVRITNNVQAALQICADNGVEVASGANSDDLPDAVAALAALIGSGGDETISVTITGTGSSLYGYAKIDGTTYTSAASGITVAPGDVIILAVGGGSSALSYGYVYIDGKTVMTVNAVTVTPQSYEWVVPSGITGIDIALSCSGNSRKTITVTTS